MPEKTGSALGKLVDCQLQLVHAAPLWQLWCGCGTFCQCRGFAVAGKEAASSQEVLKVIVRRQQVIAHFWEDDAVHPCDGFLGR